MGKYINITTTSEILINKDTTNTQVQYTGNIASISVCNNSASEAVVDLKLKAHDASVDTDEVYMLNSVKIPSGVTLLLDHDMKFNVNKYKLQFDNTGSNPDVTIIVKT